MLYWVTSVREINDTVRSDFATNNKRTLLFRRYNADKNILLEQIAMQKKRELEQKNVKKERGELLMEIRAALQNMVAMLACIRRGTRVGPKKPADEFEDGDLPIIERIETEGEIYTYICIIYPPSVIPVPPRRFGITVDREPKGWIVVWNEQFRI